MCAKIILPYTHLKIWTFFISPNWIPKTSVSVLLVWRQYRTECDGSITKRWASGNCQIIVWMKLHSWEFRCAFAESIIVASVCVLAATKQMRLCLGWAEPGGEEIHCLASTTTARQCCSKAVCKNADACLQKTTPAGRLGNKDKKQEVMWFFSSNIYVEPLTLLVFFFSRFVLRNTWTD